MNGEELGVRVARLEERMRDLEERTERVSTAIGSMDKRLTESINTIGNRQWYVLLGMVANIAGMAATIISVFLARGS